MVMGEEASVTEHRDSCRFSSVLTSAALEWLLMLLLLFDGLFSYLVTKFARFCNLQTPCLFCSRIDHILGNEKPGSYMNLICTSHKSEISSLGYCHIHQKLADVSNMCESCLLSFATKNKSHPETYRLLVGKVGLHLDDHENAHPKLPRSTADDDSEHNYFCGQDIAEIPLLNKDSISNTTVERRCSCCSELFDSTMRDVRMLQHKHIGVDSDEAGISLSSSTRDGLNKKTDKPLVLNLINHTGNHGSDRLSHIGYSEVKVRSDSDSEISLSDDGRSALVCGSEDIKQEFAARCLQPDQVLVHKSLSPSISDDMILDKFIQSTPKLEPSLSVPEQQLHEGESHDVSTLASTIAIGHGLEKFHLSKAEGGSNSPAPSESASQQVLEEHSNTKLNVVKFGDLASISSTPSGEVSKPLYPAEINLKSSQSRSHTVPSLQSHIDLNDAYKLAIGSKSNLASPKFTEVVTERDSSRFHEDLKLLISQISASRVLELAWNDLSPSPRLNSLNDEFKFCDASSSVILQNITKRLSIERNESGLDSLDGSIVSEIEGESSIDRLKRQIDLDRKSLSLLYKELEEERSASTIAANQALAMITRLQEEKSAMQMEALQYQRMMEEQAEYDQEGLQKLNELLAERENEIQDLEAEVESYRKRFTDEALECKGQESFGEGTGKISTSKSLDDYTVSIESGPVSIMSKNVGSTGASNKLGFEDEKVYISECLKRLERRLNLFSNNGVHADVSRVDVVDGYPVKTCDDFIRENCSQGNGMTRSDVRRYSQYSEDIAGENDMENPHCEDVPQGQSWRVRAASSEGMEAHVTMGGEYTRSSLCPSSDDKQEPVVGGENDLVALGKEIACLNERLQALKADQNFLEHAINSLRNGDDGVNFIQEIAFHLRDLRRIGLAWR